MRTGLGFCFVVVHRQQKKVRQRIGERNYSQVRKLLEFPEETTWELRRPHGPANMSSCLICILHDASTLIYFRKFMTSRYIVPTTSVLMANVAYGWGKLKGSTLSMRKILFCEPNWFEERKFRKFWHKSFNSVKNLEMRRGRLGRSKVRHASYVRDVKLRQFFSNVRSMVKLPFSGQFWSDDWVCM